MDPYNGIPLSNKKKGTTDVRDSMHESQKLCCVKEAGHERTYTIGFHGSEVQQAKLHYGDRNQHSAHLWEKGY